MTSKGSHGRKPEATTAAAPCDWVARGLAAHPSPPRASSRPIPAGYAPEALARESPAHFPAVYKGQPWAWTGAEWEPVDDYDVSCLAHSGRTLMVPGRRRFRW